MDRISILFQSKDLLILDKPCDMKINSNDEKDSVTVDKVLARQCPELADPTVEFGFRFAHRLDYATSGVLCIALNKQSAGRFSKLLDKKQITKHYLALIYGIPQHCSLDINVPIGKDSSHTDVNRMCVSSSPHCAHPIKSCRTILTVLETGTYNGKPASKVLLIPVTGRTHQLRVHCCHIGHRIIGDYMYSDRTDKDPPRMMLHAFRLHAPWLETVVDITAPDYLSPENIPHWHPDQIITRYRDFCDMVYIQEDNHLTPLWHKLQLNTVQLESVT